MLKCFDFVRELTFLAILVRLVVAVILGGTIGLEREIKRRPAGFRTHILVCLGAAITTLTSQYMFLDLRLYTDVARLGAQVISGIGFIGAGSIIVTRHQRVKGLTTAAGLWTSAIIGLVCGAGFIECAVVATVMIMIAELLLVKLEGKLASVAKDIRIYVEYSQASCIEQIMKIVKDRRAKLADMEITRVNDESAENYNYCALLTIQLRNGHSSEELLNVISGLEDVTTVEEI